MYYKTINIPIVLEIGENIFVHLDDILKKNHIYFKDYFFGIERFVQDERG